jgi:aryl-alcohol dehydrogenase-like predicted oxidoreductase
LLNFINHRTLDKTRFSVFGISPGNWQVSRKWGEPFSADNADKILHAAADAGMNFIDTTDVYGDGTSEKAARI